MKTSANILFIMIYCLSNILANDAVILVNKSSMENQNINNGNINLSLESKTDIYGIICSNLWIR